ncbi:interleukin-10 receptor subunit alpha isoform X2 [Hyperolius riggenbachi]|uniref:interleukin-10 receptor subunit alpha isoform X2 n=1 Tax=Hyperolius riggenbachi TaxID=752182 RepID=UPI0035A27FE6
MAKLSLLLINCVSLQIAVHLLPSAKGGILPTPPENVRFQQDFFRRILNWGHNKPTNLSVLYEVEYLRYGNNYWTSVPHCRYISEQNCDLTMETLSKSQGYFGRVRSILGNQTSQWSRSTRFTAKEVILPPPSVELTVDGPKLFVQLKLPELTVGNITQTIKEIFPNNRVYTAEIRRTSDNNTFKEEKYSESFHISSNLPDGEEYCIIIQTSISTRGNAGKPSSESCIYLPEQDVSSSTVLVVASSILIVVVLLIFANLYICLYVRRVVKTPNTLSLMMRSWSWMDKPPSPVIETILYWESGLTEHFLEEPKIFLCSSANSGCGSETFVSNLSKPIQMSPGTTTEKNLPKPAFNVIAKPLQQLTLCNRRILEERDSGISLSTDSPLLSRSTNSDGNTQSCVTCSETVVANITYLRQQEPEQNTKCSEVKELGNTWQPQIKEYLSQEPQTLQKKHVELHPEEECESFLGPWAQIPKAFHSTLPLAVPFSPLCRTMWDIGVITPSLGEVEVMDTSS